jgi:hypothetical protein
LFRSFKKTSEALAEVVALMQDQPPDVARVKARLAGLHLIDFGIANPRLPSWPSRESWIYYPIEENRKFVFAVFGLRAGQTLPMHNHPEMTVLMKPLFGEISIRSFVSDGPVSRGLLRVRDERITQLTESSGVLEIPDNSGDVHEIRALTDCAFADVVFPPYDEHGERAISYFAGTNDKLYLALVPPSSDNRSVLVKYWS